MSPSQRDYQVQMAKRLHGGPLEEGRILAFQNKVATEVSIDVFFTSIDLSVMDKSFTSFASGLRFNPSYIFSKIRL